MTDYQDAFAALRRHLHETSDSEGITLAAQLASEINATNEAQAADSSTDRYAEMTAEQLAALNDEDFREAVRALKDGEPNA